MKQIPLSEAALRLGIDYQQCRRLVLSGRLRGGRDTYGRLYVRESAVRKQERLKAGKAERVKSGAEDSRD